MDPSTRSLVIFQGVVSTLGHVTLLAAILTRDPQLRILLLGAGITIAVLDVLAIAWYVLSTRRS